MIGTFSDALDSTRGTFCMGLKELDSWDFGVSSLELSHLLRDRDHLQELFSHSSLLGDNSCSKDPGCRQGGWGGLGWTGLEKRVQTIKIELTGASLDHQSHPYIRTVVPVALERVDDQIYLIVSGSMLRGEEIWARDA